ncbi:hypothetical protein [Rubellimicrobium mesophilum]|uniref:hypothetical protein n=1 Tax=Rubellimicrobium mesophilum TaxID=1123067 RepID=UPI001B8069C0|nr:hypothetical protein [Rubellimicrobium mesophilum]
MTARFQGQTALVTGSSGMGLATALRLAKGPRSTSAASTSASTTRPAALPATSPSP